MWVKRWFTGQMPSCGFRVFIYKLLSVWDRLKTGDERLWSPFGTSVYAQSKAWVLSLTLKHFSFTTYFFHWICYQKRLKRCHHMMIMLISMIKNNHDDEHDYHNDHLHINEDTWVKLMISELVFAWWWMLIVTFWFFYKRGPFFGKSLKKKAIQLGLNWLPVKDRNHETRAWKKKTCLMYKYKSSDKRRA